MIAEIYQRIWMQQFKTSNRVFLEIKNNYAYIDR